MEQGSDTHRASGSLAKPRANFNDHSRLGLRWLIRRSRKSSNMDNNDFIVVNKIWASFQFSSPGLPAVVLLSERLFNFCFLLLFQSDFYRHKFIYRLSTTVLRGLELFSATLTSLSVLILFISSRQLVKAFKGNKPQFYS